MSKCSSCSFSSARLLHFRILYEPHAAQLMEYNFIHYKNSLGRRYCTIRYSENIKVLSLIWKGSATEESIKDVEKGVLEMLQKNECHAILNDVQDFFEAPTEFLADLTKTVWDKKVSGSAGVRFIAHVLNPETTLPAPVPASPDNPEIRFFSHKLDAVAWISSIT